MSKFEPAIRFASGECMLVGKCSKYSFEIVDKPNCIVIQPKANLSQPKNKSYNKIKRHLDRFVV